MANYRLQPIPVLNLYKRYMMHMDTCVIMDVTTEKEVVPFIKDGELYVSLLPTDKVEHIDMSLTDIYLNMVYGYTGCKPSKKLTELPANPYSIFPLPRPIYEDEVDDILIINGIEYHRWLERPQFVSKYGAVYSDAYGGFLKQSYSDRGYRKVGINKQSFSVHRIVYEAWNGEIPVNREIDHIDTLRWHNELSNLQALDHLANLEKIDKNALGKRYTEQTVVNVAKDILLGVPSAEISKKHNMPQSHVRAMWYQGLYSDILAKHDINLLMLGRDTKLSKMNSDIAELVLEYHKNNMSIEQIRTITGLSKNAIVGIINGTLKRFVK